jgi:hypothetical protein
MILISFLMKYNKYRCEAPRDEKAGSLRCFQEELMDLSATALYLVLDLHLYTVAHTCAQTCTRNISLFCFRSKTA